MMNRMRTVAPCWLASLWLLLGACSVDANKNSAYHKKCEAGERSYKGFCVKDNASGMDGEPCAPEDAQRLCFDGPMERATQSPCKPGLQTCVDGFWSASCEGQVLPKATDTCNNIDDDCDSKVDEMTSGAECSTNLLGICAAGIEVCSGGIAHCRALNDKTEEETCPVDGASPQDTNCDGLVGDQDPTLIKPCYEAAEGCTLDPDGKYACKGQCQPGTKTCDAACEHSVTPVEEQGTELIDGGMAETLDEDCDGKFDEGFGCIPGSYVCYTGPANTRHKGTCSDGVRACTDPDAGLGECMNEITPSAETCANQGVDNDCDDDSTDIDNLGARCVTSGAKGECGALATMQCDGDQLKCVPAAKSDEICGDNKDNDCDGNTDNVCAGTGTCCGAACVNTQESNLHCGGCDNVCPMGYGCCGGTCKDLSTDSKNCGACGHRCPNLLGLLTLEPCGSGVCGGK